MVRRIRNPPESMLELRTHLPNSLAYNLDQADAQSRIKNRTSKQYYGASPHVISPLLWGRKTKTNSRFLSSGEYSGEYTVPPEEQQVTPTLIPTLSSKPFDCGSTAMTEEFLLLE